MFAVATVNVGASGSITASADTGSASLPVVIFLCQTDPATGQCISGVGPTVTTTINANATPTFGIFVQGNGNVGFNPVTNRIFVRFKDGGGVTRAPPAWRLGRSEMNTTIGRPPMSVVVQTECREISPPVSQVDLTLAMNKAD